MSPGIHDLSNEDYHATTDWWSSSQLKAALPERYKTGGSQDALDFGTLFHAVVLEPDTLDAYVALDAERIGLKSDGTPAQNPTMTAAWKRAVAEAEQGGKIVVAQADWDKAHAMAEAVYRHADARRLFDQPGARPEVSIFAQDEQGIRHKARYDLLADEPIDLKSTSAKPGRGSLTRAVLDYGYDLSAAHYQEVAALAGLDLPPMTLVFCGKADPYPVTVVRLDADFIARGRALRELAIERLTNPDAPPYEGADQPLTLSPPAWARIHQPSAGIPADFTWSIYDHA